MTSNRFLARVLPATILVTGIALLTPAATLAAPAAQPPLDIKMLEYAPVGKFKATDSLPSPATGCDDVMKPLRQGEIFNPSGKWNAFDNNVFEVICLPFRGPGDTTDNDPGGNKGDPRHGFCGGAYDPAIRGNLVPLAGVCDNQQLEWSRYYAATMKEILKDFGVSIRQYKFKTGDPGVTGNTRFGTAINTAAVVPGADNPEETVIVGAHYDKTNDAPAAAWDSQEGHAEMIRMAKLMADYWKRTGTRPSATVKFVPWDAEESGVLGSQDFVSENIPPGEESKVRGYWNVDPCAGGYPSFKYGNPADRLRMGIQLADPSAIGGVSAGDAARITAFNKRAPQLVEDTLEHIDDSVTTVAGEVETFLSAEEGNGDLGKLGGIAIGTDRPVLFSSDWRNFEVLGIPFFNPGPEVTGPNQESNGDPSYGIDQSADALTSFHTPNDNLQTMMRFTGGGASGLNYSESWAKGMEFCAQLVSWGMLQPDQVGAQRTNTKLVPYYEALPNEAKEDALVTFDASGAYQYANAGTRTLVPESNLEFIWDFGDGTTGKGRVVKHAYPSVGKYTSKLTMRNKRTKAKSAMAVPIAVVPNDVGPPTLKKPAGSDVDGTFDLAFDYTGDRSGLSGFTIEESRDALVAIDDKAEKLDGWVAEDPPAGVEKWQLSDSSTPKYFGNKASSEPRSFWTGVANGSDQYSNGPSGEVSILSLKNPVQLRRGGNVALAYRSSFVNNSDDQARVQVAIDTPGREPDWIDVDSFVNGTNDEDSISIFEQQQMDDSNPGFSTRFADISRYAGRSIRVRFVYELGTPDGAPFLAARTGWYVDDIRVVSGLYREIGETKGKTFTVAGKRKGTYSYRVKAVFTDGVKSAASNVESVVVTKGAKGIKGCKGDCDLVLSLKVSPSTLRGKKPLSIAIQTEDPAQVTGGLARGKSKKLAAKLKARSTKQGKLSKLKLDARKLRKGSYTLRLTVRSGTRVAKITQKVRKR